MIKVILMGIDRRVFVEVFHDGVWVSLNPPYVDSLGISHLRGVYRGRDGWGNGKIWTHNGVVLNGCDEIEDPFKWGFECSFNCTDDSDSEAINKLNLSTELKDCIWDDESGRYAFMSITIYSLQNLRDMIAEDKDLVKNNLPSFMEDEKCAQPLYDEICNRVEAFKSMMNIENLPEEQIRVITLTY